MSSTVQDAGQLDKQSSKTNTGMENVSGSSFLPFRPLPMVPTSMSTEPVIPGYFVSTMPRDLFLQLLAINTEHPELSPVDRASLKVICLNRWLRPDGKLRHDVGKLDVQEFQEVLTRDRRLALHTELIKMDKIEMGGFEGMAQEDILKMKEKTQRYHEALMKESSCRCVECSDSWMERSSLEVSSRLPELHIPGGSMAGEDNWLRSAAIRVCREVKDGSTFEYGAVKSTGEMFSAL